MKKPLFSTAHNSYIGSWLLKKISQDDIRKFSEAHKTTSDERVLIVHSDDMYYKYCFPRHDEANVVQKEGVTVLAEKYYYTIHADDDMYDVVVCTGLLEHVPDPQKTIREMARVLKPGGKIIVSASTSFSVHCAPENYFQFTTFGITHLFEESHIWERIEAHPSAPPFRTMAILLQRICYQTDMNILFKSLFLLMAKIIPLCDAFVRHQYGDGDKNAQYEVESMLHSNVQLIAYKK